MELRQSESRNCGLYVVYVVSSEVTLFNWWEYAGNVENKIKDRGILSTEYKDKKYQMVTVAFHSRTTLDTLRVT